MFNLLINRPVKANTTPDFIPDIVLKNCALTLAHPIACICRLSLSKGCVPSAWKQAIIKPLFKKNDRHIISNYMPISLTSSISKVIESRIKTELTKFFNEHNTIPRFKYGFRN